MIDEKQDEIASGAAPREPLSPYVAPPDAAAPVPMVSPPAPTNADQATPSGSAPVESPNEGPSHTSPNEVTADLPEQGSGEAAQNGTQQDVPQAAAPATPEPTADEPPREPPKFDWYILKVASNREESIKAALLRKAKIARLDHYFGDVIVPTETITEYKNNKRRTKKQKIWPGYLIVQMELNDETWFLVRETPGIGDFTGSADRASGARPSPMLPQEIEKILAKCRPKPAKEEGEEERQKPKISFQIGQRVKIIEGHLSTFEGEVHRIDQNSGNVTVIINIFNRPTPVEVKGWHLESV